MLVFYMLCVGRVYGYVDDGGRYVKKRENEKERCVGICRPVAPPWTAFHSRDTEDVRLNKKRIADEANYIEWSTATTVLLQQKRKWSM
jgi:hypothetical protein